jgi:NAD(P)H-hydrate epimerase
MGAVKQGLLKANAWPFVGRLTVAPDIGLVPYPFSTEINWVVAEDFVGFPPLRAVATHKGSFGHLVIVAGSPGYHGAAVLCARGAQRAQPGLITLITAHEVYEPVAAQLQSVMVQTWRDGIQLPETCTAVAVGPGLAAASVPEQVKEFTRKLWQESPLPLIVDASALPWLPAGACPSNAVRVVTPHPGEAARMLNKSALQVQADRPLAVRDLSRQWGHCHVVLKGHQTMVGRSRGDLFVNSTGNPQLAQGGSGDLLAGYLGGLLAQPALQEDPAKTVRYAVWQHGASADRLGEQKSNWTIEDLAAMLGASNG